MCTQRKTFKEDTTGSPEELLQNREDTIVEETEKQETAETIRKLLVEGKTTEKAAYEIARKHGVDIHLTVLLNTDVQSQIASLAGKLDTSTILVRFRKLNWQEESYAVFCRGLCFGNIAALGTSGSWRITYAVSDLWEPTRFPNRTFCDKYKAARALIEYAISVA